MKRKPIIKQKTPLVRWPYILEVPADDVSFWPFNNSGCLGWIVNALLFVGALTLITLLLFAIVWVLVLFGIAEPLW